jgi:hypothetical protein
MSDASKNRALRMEMLRMRAAMERAQVSDALRDVRGSGGRLRNLASFAGTLSAAAAGRNRWMGLLASSVTGRPWLAALALGAVRALKRRPLLAAVAVGAVVVGLRAAKVVGPSSGSTSASTSDFADTPDV